MLDSLNDSIEDESKGVDILGRLVDAIIKAGWPEDRIQQVKDDWNKPESSESYVDRLTKRHAENHYRIATGQQIVERGASSAVTDRKDGIMTDTKSAYLEFEKEAEQGELPLREWTPEEIHERTLKQIQQQVDREARRPVRQTHDPFRRLRER